MKDEDKIRIIADENAPRDTIFLVDLNDPAVRKVMSERHLKGLGELGLLGDKEYGVGHDGTIYERKSDD